MKSNDQKKLKGMYGMKGLFLSVLTILIFTLLIQFAINIQNAKLSMNSALNKIFFAEKLGYYLDDISVDLRTIVFVDIPANSTRMTFIENLTINKSVFFSNYTQFLTNYSNLTNTNVSFSATDPFQIIFSNGLAYQTDYSNRLIKLFNSTDSSNASITEYRIDITSTVTRGAVFNPTFVASGTFMVVNYTDPIPGKSFFTSGFVDPTVGNVMEIRLPSPASNAKVTVGLIDGRNNSFMFNQTGVDAFQFVTISLNRTTANTVSAFYNSSLNISLPNANFSGIVPAN